MNPHKEPGSQTIPTDPFMDDPNSGIKIILNKNLLTRLELVTILLSPWSWTVNRP